MNDREKLAYLAVTIRKNWGELLETQLATGQSAAKPSERHKSNSEGSTTNS